MISRKQQAVELMRAYRKNPDVFSDQEAEHIAQIAKDFHLHFPRESKAVRKLIFDVVDTAVLGMMPNSLRPQSRGETVFGETDTDRYAGMIGTGIGAIGTGSFLLRGGRLAKAIGRGMGYGQRAAQYGQGVAQRGMAAAGRVGANMGRYGEAVGRQARSARGAYQKGLSSLDRGKSVNFIDDFKAGYRRGYNPLRPVQPSQQDLLSMTMNQPGF